MAACVILTAATLLALLGLVALVAGGVTAKIAIDVLLEKDWPAPRLMPRAVDPAERVDEP